MTCPHLEYRRGDEDHEFDHERPYCAVIEEFVSPVKADICNDRFDFDHTNCEFYEQTRQEQPQEATTDDD